MPNRQENQEKGKRFLILLIFMILAFNIGFIFGNANTKNVEKLCTQDKFENARPYGDKMMIYIPGAANFTDVK